MENVVKFAIRENKFSRYPFQRRIFENPFVPSENSEK